ncbi:MAG: hypothetical protein WCJ84_06020 [Candidatus Peregrinibacteria bacterium]
MALNDHHKNFKGFDLFPGEEVRFVMREHWIVHLLAFISWIFWGVCAVIMVALGAYFLGIRWGSPTSYFLGAILLMYLSVVTLYSFISWLNKVLNVIVVTSDRVVDITQIDFFHRNIIETRLEHVQDATGTVKGFLNTLFNWGEVRIRTANDVADFYINMVYDPHANAREVFNLASEAKMREHKMVQRMQTPPPPKTPENRQEKFHRKIETILENPKQDGIYVPDGKIDL